jgi:uncharacterized protein YcaQ
VQQKEIPADEARRIALAAHGFGKPRPKGRVTVVHMRQAIRQLGLLQLDFVNVLVPAHYLVLFSRLGAYDRDRLHRLLYRQQEFTEQWAHEASIVPAAHWPLLEHRRKAFRPWPNTPIMRLKNRSTYLSQVIDLIYKTGAVTSADLPPVAGPKRRPGDWHRSVPRWALEYHFGFGALAVADRLANFQRVYDLPERIIAAPYRDRQVGRREGQRELLRTAANALGIATTQDLADYYRMTAREAQPRLNELVEAGAIRAARVAGWKQPAYLAANARRPRSIRCAALLSPFDPVVWYRPRALRLFDFHYRIEIYVPAAKRKWGYYVLPFLLDERIVARVDLKADRANGRLLVQACHKEDGIDQVRTIEKLGDELLNLADWLGLDSVKVSLRGPFARHLAASMKTKQ